MQARIINRGRGPEIEGTRITVFVIMDYLRAGWHHSQIALDLGLSSSQVQAAKRYIEDHTEELMPEYQEMLDRDAQGNPPELQARLDATHAKFQELVAQPERLRTFLQEHRNGRNSGGQ